jgi:hypothetical protein
MNSNVSSVSPSLNSFEYEPVPSMFRIAECPIYLCWKSVQFSKSLWNRDAINNWEYFKNRTIALTVGIGGYLGGIVALPITMYLTPFTLVADLVTGVVDCSFCYYKGLNKENLSIIAKHKFIIAPCQQLTFCLGVIAGLGVISFVISVVTLNPSIGFLSSLLLWHGGYAFGQAAVGLLPENLNHHSFNIFINGGSGEWADREKKWIDVNSAAPEAQPTK